MLIELEKAGVTQGSISEDSDLFTFCGNIIINKLNSHTKTCYILDRKEIMTQRFPRWNDEDIILLSVLLGCDYIDRIKNNGIVKCVSLIDAMYNHGST